MSDPGFIDLNNQDHIDWVDERAARWQYCMEDGFEKEAVVIQEMLLSIGIDVEMSAEGGGVRWKYISWTEPSFLDVLDMAVAANEHFEETNPVVRKFKIADEGMAAADPWAHRSEGMRCRTCMWYGWFCYF